jgi:hypothetical protein
MDLCDDSLGSSANTPGSVDEGMSETGQGNLVESNINGIGSWLDSVLSISGPDIIVEEATATDERCPSEPDPDPSTIQNKQGKDFDIKWVEHYSKQTFGRLLDNSIQEVPVPVATAVPSLTQRETESVVTASASGPGDEGLDATHQVYSLGNTNAGMRTTVGPPTAFSSAQERQPLVPAEQAPLPARSWLTSAALLQHLESISTSDQQSSLDSRSEGSCTSVQESPDSSTSLTSMSPRSGGNFGDLESEGFAFDDTHQLEPEIQYSDEDSSDSYMMSTADGHDNISNYTSHIRQTTDVGFHYAQGGNSDQSGTISNSTYIAEDLDNSRGPQTSSKKRGREPNTTGEERPRGKNQIKRQKGEESTKSPLACPYYKKDPIRYRRCYSHVLTRISYVKQHLFRSHKQPIHCFVCMAAFENDSDLREHTRDQSCERKPYVTPDGMTRDQEETLRKSRADQKKPEKEQWYDIFKTLFPGVELPLSPYVDNDISEDASNLHEFIEARGSEIIEQRLQERLGNNDNIREDIQVALREMWDLWKSERRDIAGY